MKRFVSSQWRFGCNPKGYNTQRNVTWLSVRVTMLRESGGNECRLWMRNIRSFKGNDIVYGWRRCWMMFLV